MYLIILEAYGPIFRLEELVVVVELNEFFWWGSDSMLAKARNATKEEYKENRFAYSLWRTWWVILQKFHMQLPGCSPTWYSKEELEEAIEQSPDIRTFSKLLKKFSGSVEPGATKEKEIKEPHKKLTGGEGRLSLTVDHHVGQLSLSPDEQGRLSLPTENKERNHGSPIN